LIGVSPLASVLDVKLTNFALKAARNLTKKEASEFVYEALASISTWISPTF
jgi:hypothetical protein